MIENGVLAAPANATAEQQQLADASKLMDLKVKNYPFQSIDRTILETILKRDTAKNIWDAMRRKYQGSTKDGEIMEQVIVVEKILRYMTEKFNYVVCSITESNDVTTMSIDELQSSLLVHEKLIKGKKNHGVTVGEEQALKVSNAGRGRGRNSSSRGRGRGRQSKDLVECYKCHKLGHYWNECPDWDASANYAEFGSEEEMLLMAFSNMNTDCKYETWYLDSGCNNHMVETKNWLFEFDESFRESVKWGNDSKMVVMGKGNVKLNIEGRIHVITDVYYLPGLGNNLLSIGQLQQKGITIIFKNNTCQLFHEEKGLIISTAMTANRIYIINASMMIPKCLQMTKDEETNLWHKRYAHLTLKGLKVLTGKNMVKGLPELKDNDDKCNDCLSGKQHGDSIPKQANWRAPQKLELVHSDIYGPLNPKFNGGNTYFITFTNYLTRKTWTYFMQEKPSAFELFKKSKSLDEKESGCLIKCLRTDRGGEFTSTMFNDLCSSQGIKRQLTASYTPQQNGVSERKNKTLLNMVRSMLSCRDVPKRFGQKQLIGLLM
ncbi:unnamed protein product [Trifolium pratense]|uniref:Uncharacterized protein n=1 Tax=Trifolium pratense TaxID=57577 RepID=A0ACB0ISD4_TRIPR|nr:unnamed protein product [Trifolium pratense]